MGLSGLDLGYDLGSAEQHPSAARDLERYATALQSLPGASPAEAKNLSAAVFEVDAEALNMAAIEECLAELVSGSNNAD